MSKRKKRRELRTRGKIRRTPFKGMYGSRAEANDPTVKTGCLPPLVQKKPTTNRLGSLTLTGSKAEEEFNPQPFGTPPSCKQRQLLHRPKFYIYANTTVWLRPFSNKRWEDYITDEPMEFEDGDRFDDEHLVFRGPTRWIKVKMVDVYGMWRYSGFGWDDFKHAMEMDIRRDQLVR